MKPEKISLINQNGTIITISKRSYDMLTVKNKNKFQVLAPTVKIEIPTEVKEFMLPSEPIPDPLPEPIPEPISEPTPEPIQEPLLVDNPELIKKMQEYNMEPIPIPMVEHVKPHVIAEMHRMRRELKEGGIKTNSRMKLTDIKKLYDDFKKQKNG